MFCRAIIDKSELKGAAMGSLLKSTRNTRQLPVGNLRYLRSDCPDELSDEEVQWLRSNNIVTIVDLRDKTEYTQRVCRLEYEEGFVYYHLPVTGGGSVPASPEAVANSYVKMVDAQMVEIVDTIMSAKTNVLFFCNAGKDRTGVVSAIILKRMGFDDAQIIADYMETKTNLMPFLQEYSERHPEVDLRTIIPSEENIKAVLALY